MVDRPTEEASNAVADRFISRFQRRAAYYIASTLAIGAAIIVLLGFCGYIFFFAQDIAGRGVNVDLLFEVQREREYLDDTSAFLDISLRGVREEARVGQRTTFDILTAEKRLAENRVRSALLREKERLMRDEKYFSDSDTVLTKEEFEALAAAYAIYIESLETATTTVNEEFNRGERTRTDVPEGRLHKPSSFRRPHRCAFPGEYSSSRLPLQYAASGLLSGACGYPPTVKEHERFRLEGAGRNADANSRVR